MIASPRIHTFNDNGDSGVVQSSVLQYFGSNNAAAITCGNRIEVTNRSDLDVVVHVKLFLNAFILTLPASVSLSIKVCRDPDDA